MMTREQMKDEEYFCEACGATHKFGYLDRKGLVCGAQYGELESRNSLLKAAINALMAERRALRSLAAAYGMSGQISRARLCELGQEHLRLEGAARRACKAAGIELRNNDQPLEMI